MLTQSIMDLQLIVLVNSIIRIIYFFGISQSFKFRKKFRILYCQNLRYLIQQCYEIQLKQLAVCVLKTTLKHVSIHPMTNSQIIIDNLFCQFFYNNCFILKNQIHCHYKHFFYCSVIIIIEFAMESAEDKIQYVTFKELNNPQLELISCQNVEQGFESKEWRKQFQTLTHLREANRYYGVVFLQELLPKIYKSILLQIDNLRSNNSKEALTLVCEILQHQNIMTVQEQIIRSIINALFIKSVSEKSFIKNQALKAIDIIPKKSNPYIVAELNHQTQSINGQISELAIKCLHSYLSNNQLLEIDSNFLRSLSRNINGKRSLIQKKSRQILQLIKNRKGQIEIENMIDNFADLGEQQSNILKKEIKKPTQKPKSTQSLKDFIKARKKVQIAKQEEN